MGPEYTMSCESAIQASPYGRTHSFLGHEGKNEVLHQIAPSNKSSEDVMHSTTQMVMVMIMDTNLNSSQGQHGSCLFEE